MLLASSLGTSHAMWDPQVGTLAVRYRVVRCDRRGHGASPVIPGGTTIDDLGGWGTVNDELFEPETGSVAKIYDEATG